eukprot:c12822_g1_i4.p1 GENE.c12822_g1_i4~~c12822_g1_i4.p1  ORF type:complete len:381 (+),score=87.68 c12822_g1_i4:356-1498(+)
MSFAGPMASQCQCGCLFGASFSFGNLPGKHLFQSNPHIPISLLDQGEDNIHGDADKPSGWSGDSSGTEEVPVLSDPNLPHLAVSYDPKDRIFGQKFDDCAAAVHAESPWKHCSNWRLISMIVKSNDDCRQEQFALLLVREFQLTFEKANLPLFVKPYSVIPTSSTASLIETVPDAISIHGFKKTANINSAVEFGRVFKVVFGKDDMIPLDMAQRNFVESMAGYSLLCYLLQLKDRHNGNILLMRTGHIVHIDFGFLLGLSPGSISFESAPFKLSDDMLEVMDGKTSPLFAYFRTLFITGYLELRRHRNRLAQLLQIMMAGSNLPCFRDRMSVIIGFCNRLCPSMSDREAEVVANELINDSLDNWRTRQYDKFQKFTNNIL